MPVVRATLHNLSCSQLNSINLLMDTHSFKNQIVYWETCASSTSLQASNYIPYPEGCLYELGIFKLPLIFKSKRGILDIAFILEEPNKLNTLIQSHTSITALLGF